MPDFKLLLNAKQIVQQLDQREISGEGLSWERVLLFAKQYDEITDAMYSKTIESTATRLPASSYTLSADQERAWERLSAWAASDEPYFVLRGVAGGGKTFLLQMLKTLPVTTFFTAPTNKATKVLRRMLSTEAKTTYSLLGLKMEQRDEKLVLEIGKQPSYLPPRSILVVDECFVAETLIDTPFGQKRIDTITKGDKIINAYGVDTVVATLKKKAETVVKINTNRKTSYYCSESHRFFTQRGYVCARNLRHDDTLIQTSEAMRLLQNKVQSSEEQCWLTEILFSELRNKLESPISGAKSAEIRKETFKKCRYSTETLVKFRQSESSKRNRKDSELKPIKFSYSSQEDQQNFESYRTQTKNTRRKRARAYTFSERIVKQVIKILDSRTSSEDRLVKRTWNSFYNRYCSSKKDDRNRMRRRFPREQKSTSNGSSERSISQVSRVDSVKIYKSTDTELDRFRDSEGNVYLYDLKAEQHPSFSVTGNLVHNCSMIGEQLADFIEQVRRKTQCKVLYVGDPAQLPPVSERRSPTWQATKNKQCRAYLKQVMRYDNELLVLATAVRECIQEQAYDTRITAANDGERGVFILRDFTAHLTQHQQPRDWIERKVLAWRNRTVERYNNLLRSAFGFEEPYVVDDVLLLAEPIEENGNIIASVDDEVIVQEVNTARTYIHHEGSKIAIPVWLLRVTGDRDLHLRIPMQENELQSVLAQKAQLAHESVKSARRAAWKDFWDTKNRFNRVRYGYAITAHRAQGSTYTECYVDQQDILANPNKREAYRCLYTACTRASTNIYSY